MGLEVEELRVQHLEYNLPHCPMEVVPGHQLVEEQVVEDVLQLILRGLEVA